MKIEKNIFAVCVIAFLSLFLFSCSDNYTDTQIYNAHSEVTFETSFHEFDEVIKSHVQNELNNDNKSAQYYDDNTVELTTLTEDIGSIISEVSMRDTPESSCFSEIGYSDEHMALIVVFRDSGKKYVYQDVPQEVWNSLINADSLGGFYNSNIKGQYDCQRYENVDMSVDSKGQSPARSSQSLSKNPNDLYDGIPYIDGNEVELVSPGDENIFVWVPVNGGKKYHAYASCSGMDEPQYIPLSIAKLHGYAKCKKRCCYGE